MKKGSHCTCHNPVAELYDTNIFFSVSPSVYAVFSNIAASNACGPLGSSYEQLTASFATTELSTLSSVVVSDKWQSCATLPFNFADLNGCDTSSKSSSKIPSETSLQTLTTKSEFPDIFIPGGATTTTPDFSLYAGPDQKCAPSIALGAWVMKLDPAWTACSISALWNPVDAPVYGGFVWDPPRALVSVGSLLDPITTQSGSITMAPAAPSAAPQPVAAITSTTGAAQAPPSSQAGSNPPAASDPEPPSSHAASSSLVDADPPATSGSGLPLSNVPLKIPSPLDGSTLNPAPSAETTNTPLSASSPSDPSASDPEHLSNHAASPDLLPVTAFSVAGESITAVAGSPGVFIMKGETITQGAAPATIGSLQVSWDQGSIFVNGKGASVFLPSSTQPFQPAAASAALFVASAVEDQLTGGAVVISGSTVIPGAPAVTIDNVAYSVDPAASNIVIGGQTQTLSAIRPYPATTLANVFVATAAEGQLSGGAVVISGSTVVPGAPAVTINNVAYSLDPAASHIVVGGQTKILSAISPNPISQPANAIIAGETVAPAAPGASVFVIGDKTLSLNGPAVTISNTPVSLAPGGNIIIGTSTLKPQSRPTDPPNSGLSYITIGGEVFTAIPGNIVAAGKTLTPGGPPITISGTPVSLGLSALIVGTETEKITIPPTGTNKADQANAKIAAATGKGATVSYFTVDGETFAVGANDVVVGGKTLTPGGPGITVSGVRVSLGASAFIVGTRTEAFTAPTPGASAGIGGLIMSGIGGIGGGAVTTGAGDSPSVVVADAVRQVVMSGLWLLPVIVCMVF